MLRQLTLIAFGAAAVFVAAAVFAQAPAQGTIVKSKSNITNNIVAGANGRLKCVTPAGKPCTSAQASELNAAIRAGYDVKKMEGTR